MSPARSLEAPGALGRKRHFLFDLDGTLVDSSPAHDRAYQAALRALCPELLSAFRYEATKGKPTAEAFRELGVADPERLASLVIHKQRGYLERIAAGEVRLYAGARELLAWLAASGRKAYLATGASRRSTERVLSACGLEGAFIEVVTADDVKRGKPSPECFARLVERWQLPRAECVVIEDAESGVVAAHRAQLEVAVMHPPERGTGDLWLPGFDALLARVREASAPPTLALPHASRGGGQGSGHAPLFVIPAAGRGSRLGIEVPKILAPVTAERSVWSVLRERLRPLAAHVHVVLSPDGLPQFERAAAAEIEAGAVSVSVQPVPRGMGDAIFGAGSAWRGQRDLFVLWGDQLGISTATLRRTVAAQRAQPGPGVTLPVTRLTSPYVQYDFDAAGGLTAIRQSREGEACDVEGFSDVGLFALSTEGLWEAWAAFAATQAPGAQTGEANFLPFLAALSKVHGWPVRRLTVADASEARGLNTPEDLAFFRRRLLEEVA